MAVAFIEKLYFVTIEVSIRGYNWTLECEQWTFVLVLVFINFYVGGVR